MSLIASMLAAEPTDKSSINPQDYAPKGTFDPAANGAGDILNWLSWAVSAAAVAGIITVGIQLSIQLRRGEPGEGSGYFRGLITVLGACIVGASAAPIVNFLL